MSDEASLSPQPPAPVPRSTSSCSTSSSSCSTSTSSRSNSKKQKAVMAVDYDEVLEEIGQMGKWQVAKPTGKLVKDHSHGH